MNGRTYEDYVDELSGNLRRLRSEAKLSQEQLAHAAGLAGFTYQKFEKGESRPGAPMNPGLATLLGLCQALGVSLAELLPAWVPDVPPRLS